MWSMKSIAIFLTIIIQLFGRTTAFFINIDANEEQCFFDRVTSGTNMGLMFEVSEGGFLDIDVKVGFRVMVL